MRNIVYQIIGIIANKIHNHLQGIDATSSLTSMMALKPTSMSHFATSHLKIGISKHVGDIKIRINIGDVQDNIGINIQIIINIMIANMMKKKNIHIIKTNMTTKKKDFHINMSEQDVKKIIRNGKKKSGISRPQR